MNINHHRFMMFLSTIFLLLACNIFSSQSTPSPNFSLENLTSTPSLIVPTLQSTPVQAENPLPLLAFISGEYTGIYAIYEMGGTYKEIFDIPPGFGPQYLSMSPDCTEYIYTHDLRDDSDIGDQLYLYSTKTQTATRLTDPNKVGHIEDPSWSPDGKQIAFLGVGKERSVSEVYIINSDGSNMQQLPGLSNQAQGCLAWSPDGTKFAYAKVEGEYSSYGVMNADGTNIQEILRVDGYNLSYSCVSWSPDNKKILLLVQRSNEENLGIYRHDFAIVNSDGTDLHYITKPSDDPLYANSDEFEPAWSPDGNLIAYTYLKNLEQFLIYVMDPEDNQRKSIGTVGYGFELYGTSPTWCSQR